MRGYYYKGRAGSTRSTSHATHAARRGRTGATTLAFVLGLFSVAGFSPSAYAAEPDPYLSAINAEGGRLEFLGKAKKEEEALLRLEAAEKKQAKPQPAQAVQPVTAAASANTKSFEENLQKSFPGSYALYSLMDTSEKQQVLAEYQKRTAEGAGRYIPVIKKIIAITNAKRARD